MKQNERRYTIHGNSIHIVGDVLVLGIMETTTVEDGTLESKLEKLRDCPL